MRSHNIERSMTGEKGVDHMQIRNSTQYDSTAGISQMHQDPETVSGSGGNITRMLEPLCHP